MGANLNKKVLCFLDEHGSAGAGEFSLGAVLVLARDAGRIDKCFSNLLEPSANEVHAAGLDDGYLQSLLQRFWAATPAAGRLVLINQQVASREGAPAILYAQAVAQTVKAGLKRFQADVLGRETIGNVDVIVDANHHNDHPLFQAEVERARREDGRFRGVNRVTCLDSAASRLLQLADVVAYARKWVTDDELNARALRQRFGIQLP